MGFKSGLRFQDGGRFSFLGSKPDLDLQNRVRVLNKGFEIMVTVSKWGFKIGIWFQIRVLSHIWGFK